MAEETPTIEKKINPLQELCWSLYIDPESDTFGNAYQSAVKAGYEHNTAVNITQVPWFIRKLERLNRSKRALKNLDEVVELKREEMLDEKGQLRGDLLKHRSEVSSKILEVTEEEWNPRKKLDISSLGKQIQTIKEIKYVIPEEPKHEIGGGGMGIGA